jgi:SulP family sulfate permease
MINVKTSGARTRLSTFLAGVILLILVVALGPLVGVIPMAALVAVMIVVAGLTFDWHSVAPATLRRMPKSETAVMVVTVSTVTATSNLAIGVVAGTVTAMVLFARRVAHLIEVTSVTDPDGNQVIYDVHGELFFASSSDFITQFDYARDPDDVVIDMTHSHIWDASSVAALDAVTHKYERYGKTVRILGLNNASDLLHGRLSGQLSSHA